MAEPQDKLFEAITDLVRIVRKLRSPSGCSWDREQTVLSLSPFMLEEAYEVADAIEKNDMKLLRTELGDLLLHVIMSADICEEQNEFSLKDVVEGISEKLIRRHPHVFKEHCGLSASDVEKQWEAIKASEKKDEGFFSSIPSVMPALQTAWRIQQSVIPTGILNPRFPSARHWPRRITKCTNTRGASRLFQLGFLPGILHHLHVSFAKGITCFFEQCLHPGKPLNEFAVIAP